jgi:L-amino acid N-acyltransferase YncA
MMLRVAEIRDAEAIHAIYAPIVSHSAISFEIDPPTVAQVRDRIAQTLPQFPWLVSIDAQGGIDGYAYASRHRERAAYQWSVDTAVYVRADARGTGVGKRLYRALFDELVALGYYHAYAGIALPNAASVALHETVGFTPIGVYRNVGYKLGAWRDVGWWQKSLQPLRVPAPPAHFI